MEWERVEGRQGYYGELVLYKNNCEGYWIDMTLWGELGEVLKGVRIKRFDTERIGTYGK